TTGLVGDPTCGTATPCDDFALTVTVPSGFDATNDVRVTIGWPNSAADFDLYVLNASGASVTSSASSSDPEIAVFPAVAGTYTLRVVPFAPAGQSYSGTA